MPRKSKKETYGYSRDGFLADSDEEEGMFGGGVHGMPKLDGPVQDQAGEDDGVRDDYSNPFARPPEGEYLLYKLLGVERTAQPAEIRKQYKILSLKFHPDRNPDDPSATARFQALSEAYKILIDPKSKEFYDRTGETSEYGASRNFQDAYEYYRDKFGYVQVEDIEEFEKTYKNSPEEREDLLGYIRTFEGDMRALLEHIPLSEEFEIPRFLEEYERMFADGTIEKSFKRRFDNTKFMIRVVKKELTTAESQKRLKGLADQIRSNNRDRRDIFAHIMSKYSGGRIQGAFPMSIEDGEVPPHPDPLGEMEASKSQRLDVRDALDELMPRKKTKRLQKDSEPCKKPSSSSMRGFDEVPDLGKRGYQLRPSGSRSAADEAMAKLNDVATLAVLRKAIQKGHQTRREEMAKQAEMISSDDEPKPTPRSKKQQANRYTACDLSSDLPTNMNQPEYID